MKPLLRNIWEAPAATMAGALVAGLTFLQVAEVEMPTWATLTIGSLAAVLAVFSGPNKSGE